MEILASQQFPIQAPGEVIRSQASLHTRPVHWPLVELCMVLNFKGY